MPKNSIFLLCLAVIMLFSNSGMAAQSTADVPVTKELLTSARDRILGPSAQKVKDTQEYIIGHGDVLSVQVYGEGDMSIEAPSGTRVAETEGDSLRSGVGRVIVRIDGKISLKHVGDVPAVGFTLTQLADYLKEIFATVYDDPVVTVVLGQSNSQRYTVMGKVLAPGIFYLDYPINLVQVVARCGGFNEWANSELTVVRKDAGDSELFRSNTLKFDYDDFLAGKKLERNIFIKSDDIVIVH
ncbi:MAG: polysaccharide biosynthesis/export family protein [Desulforhopalus sp.]